MPTRDPDAGGGAAAALANASPSRSYARQPVAAIPAEAAAATATAHGRAAAAAGVGGGGAGGGNVVGTGRLLELENPALLGRFKEAVLNVGYAPGGDVAAVGGAGDAAGRMMGTRPENGRRPTGVSGSGSVGNVNGGGAVAGPSSSSAAPQVMYLAKAPQAPSGGLGGPASSSAGDPLIAPYSAYDNPNDRLVLPSSFVRPFIVSSHSHSHSQPSGEERGAGGGGGSDPFRKRTRAPAPQRLGSAGAGGGGGGGMLHGASLASPPIVTGTPHYGLSSRRGTDGLTEAERFKLEVLGQDKRERKAQARRNAAAAQQQQQQQQGDDDETPRPSMDAAGVVARGAATAEGTVVVGTGGDLAAPTHESAVAATTHAGTFASAATQPVAKKRKKKRDPAAAAAAAAALGQPTSDREPARASSTAATGATSAHAGLIWPSVNPIAGAARPVVQQQAAAGAAAADESTDAVGPLDGRAARRVSRRRRHAHGHTHRGDRTSVLRNAAAGASAGQGGLTRGASMRRMNVWDAVPEPEAAETAVEPPPVFPYFSSSAHPPTYDRSVPEPSLDATASAARAHSPPPDFDRVVGPSRYQLPKIVETLTQDGAENGAADISDSDGDSGFVSALEESPEAGERHAKLRADRAAWEADLNAGLSLEERVQREMARRSEAQSQLHQTIQSPDSEPKSPEAESLESRFTKEQKGKARAQMEVDGAEELLVDRPVGGKTRASSLLSVQSQATSPSQYSSQDATQEPSPAPKVASPIPVLTPSSPPLGRPPKSPLRSQPVSPVKETPTAAVNLGLAIQAPQSPSPSSGPDGLAAAISAMANPLQPKTPPAVSGDEAPLQIVEETPKANRTEVPPASPSAPTPPAKEPLSRYLEDPELLEVLHEEPSEIPESERSPVPPSEGTSPHRPLFSSRRSSQTRQSNPWRLLRRSSSSKQPTATAATAQEDEQSVNGEAARPASVRRTSSFFKQLLQPGLGLQTPDTESAMPSLQETKSADTTSISIAQPMSEQSKPQVAQDGPLPPARAAALARRDLTQPHETHVTHKHPFNRSAKPAWMQQATPFSLDPRAVLVGRDQGGLQQQEDIVEDRHAPTHEASAPIQVDGKEDPETESLSSDSSSEASSGSSSEWSVSDAVPRAAAAYRFYPPRGIPQAVLTGVAEGGRRPHEPAHDRARPAGPRHRPPPPPLPRRPSEQDRVAIPKTLPDEAETSQSPAPPPLLPPRRPLQPTQEATNGNARRPSSAPQPPPAKAANGSTEVKPATAQPVVAEAVTPRDVSNGAIPFPVAKVSPRVGAPKKEKKPAAPAPAPRMRTASNPNVQTVNSRAKLGIKARIDDRPEIEMQSQLAARIRKWRALYIPPTTEEVEEQKRAEELVDIWPEDVKPTSKPAPNLAAQEAPARPSTGTAAIAKPTRKPSDPAPRAVPIDPSATQAGFVAPRYEYTELDLMAANARENGREFEAMNEITDFVGDGVARGASPDALANLLIAPVEVESRRTTKDGKTKSKLTSLGIRVAKCSVCLNAFRGGDVMAMMPNCQHFGHQKCVVEWLSRDARCMVCRVPL